MPRWHAVVGDADEAIAEDRLIDSGIRVGVKTEGCVSGCPVAVEKNLCSNQHLDVTSHLATRNREEQRCCWGINQDLVTTATEGDSDYR